MKEIKKTTYVKNGYKWVESHTTTDTLTIYDNLSRDLIAKKLHNCAYIKRISDQPNYDGTRTITVYYDNNVKNVYVIEW